MAEILPPPATHSAQQKTIPISSSIVHKSNTGQDYTFGIAIPKGMSFTSDPALFARSTPAPVNWPPVEDWVPQDSATIASTNCTRYKIPVGGIFYQYRLWFTANASGQYVFTRASGQTLGCLVILTSEDHYIDYNDSNPTIVNVNPP